MSEAQTTGVLVVGGSLVGLSAAMFLAWRGVPTVLVERYPGSSPHPRAIGYTPRTLELFHAVGLDVPEAPANFRLRRARVESLAGTWFEESAWNPAAEAQLPDRPRYSPHTGAAIAQDALEPMLRRKAREFGADLRLETEFLEFREEDGWVVAKLRGKNQKESEVRAQYMIAADGHRSLIRESLGIGRQGRGHIRTLRSVLFRAPLESYLERGVHQFSIDQTDLKGFLTTYADGRWVLMVSDDETRDGRLLIEKAIGRSDLPIEILATGRWELSALVADAFSRGRVFLAGDAAHCLPPTRGGYGANTGIDDAHNLAWKLAAVLKGSSNPALLETYDAERRAIAWLRHDQTFARPDYKAEAAGLSGDVPILDDDAIEFGQLYRSKAVLGLSPALPSALRPDQWAGQPGTRAPHVVLSDGRSTLDLFQRGWVVVATDPAWAGAALEVKRRLGIDLEVLSADVHEAYGIGLSGASIVRPDGYIAGRAADLPADPASALADTIRQAASMPAA